MADLTAAYGAALGRQRAWLLALLAAVFGRAYDPASPVPSLTAIGALAGMVTVRGQGIAVAGARSYLAALTGTPIQSWPVPADLIGMSDSGRAVSDLTRLAPAVYLHRRTTGLGEAAAGLAALAWLNAIAASEPVRAANATVLLASRSDRRLSGRYRRAARAGACPFCRDIAESGLISAGAPFAAHANCQCVAEPEVRTA